MRRVVVTGATGTIGRAVVAALHTRGDHVVALSRDAERARAVLGNVEVHAWRSPTRQSPPSAALDGAHAIIHLLGEPIGQRWTAAVKRELRDSRLRSTRLLTRAIHARATGSPPLTFVSQSATGFYGLHGDAWLTEQSPPGTDFLARLVVDWEHESLAAAAAPNVRVVVSRTGVVLSSHGGALEKMAPPFKFGVGGPIAGGRQYVPWVHIDDVVGALLHCLDTRAAAGPINVVSPNPATNAELSRALGHALHRPALLPVPGFAVRALYGEMSMTVIGGQRVSAAKLEGLGYVFVHPHLDTALRDVLSAAA
ncbi:MAG: TIGR01777 family protein [Candidatus Aeolococcus gillhamiae]|uniref:TIGR01777 family protein n=1 Tax=Candidatus Aeolococcus gillhamiae TaxID=3127015 RepID=A0A2W5YX88_9BACT|nr:MAG: TIGR01777 family protein [Candidatus Dormibacter sp. RRmetagenome_bin12]